MVDELLKYTAMFSDSLKNDIHKLSKMSKIDRICSFLPIKCYIKKGKYYVLHKYYDAFNPISHVETDKINDDIYIRKLVKGGFHKFADYKITNTYNSGHVAFIDYSTDENEVFIRIFVDKNLEKDKDKIMYDKKQINNELKDINMIFYMYYNIEKCEINIIKYPNIKKDKIKFDELPDTPTIECGDPGKAKYKSTKKTEDDDNNNICEYSYGNINFTTTNKVFEDSKLSVEDIEIISQLLKTGYLEVSDDFIVNNNLFEDESDEITKRYENGYSKEDFNEIYNKLLEYKINEETDFYNTNVEPLLSNLKINDIFYPYLYIVPSIILIDCVYTYGKNHVEDEKTINKYYKKISRLEELILQYFNIHAMINEIIVYNGKRYDVSCNQVTGLYNNCMNGIRNSIFRVGGDCELNTHADIALIETGKYNAANEHMLFNAVKDNIIKKRFPLTVIYTDIQENKFIRTTLTSRKVYSYRILTYLINVIGMKMKLICVELLRKYLTK